MQKASPEFKEMVNLISRGAKEAKDEWRARDPVNAFRKLVHISSNAFAAPLINEHYNWVEHCKKQKKKSTWDDIARQSVYEWQEVKKYRQDVLDGPGGHMRVTLARLLGKHGVPEKCKVVDNVRIFQFWDKMDATPTDMDQD